MAAQTVEESLCFLLCFETGSYVDGLLWPRTLILLPVPLKCWDYRHAALCLAISRVFRRWAYTRVQCYSQQPKVSAWDGGKLLETACLTMNHLHAMGQHTSCHGATELWTSRSPRSANFMLHAFYHNKNKWVKNLTAWFNFTKDSLLNRVLAKFCFLLRVYFNSDKMTLGSAFLEIKSWLCAFRASLRDSVREDLAMRLSAIVGQDSLS